MEDMQPENGHFSCFYNSMGGPLLAFVEILLQRGSRNICELIPSS